MPRCCIRLLALSERKWLSSGAQASLYSSDDKCKDSAAVCDHLEQEGCRFLTSRSLYSKTRCKNKSYEDCSSAESSDEDQPADKKKSTSRAKKEGSSSDSSWSAESDNDTELPSNKKKKHAQLIGTRRNRPAAQNRPHRKVPIPKNFCTRSGETL